MDPRQSQKYTRKTLNSKEGHMEESASSASGNDQTSQNIPGQTDPGTQREADRQPQCLGGFTVIPPNESRRSKIKAMAQKEEEEFQRYKETHRPASVHMNPERLGGDVTLAEARQKQHADLRCSKLQKKLKKEELDKKKKLEEEEELQRMKDRQREKAERLEEKKKNEEERRRRLFLENHVRTNESFLLKVDKTAADLAKGAVHTSVSKDLENKEPGKLFKNMKEVQQEHMRVNKAFLDKLEQQSRESTNETKKETVQKMECLCLVPDNFEQTTGHVSLSHLKADPEQSCSRWTKRTEPEPKPDHDWALMKLINHFPDCCKSFLEDILHQVDGDYDQAYTLLISTLS